MIKIDDIQFDKILPYSIKNDKTVQDLAQALDKTFNKISANIDKVLLWDKIDTLPEEILDLLAYQLKVDYYDIMMPTAEQKRILIKDSIRQHKIKGTPAAVEKLVSFYFESAKVLENWEYEGGEPYHFKIIDILAPLPSIRILMNFIRVIYTCKNTRSWCDEARFKRNSTKIIYYGAFTALFKSITLRPHIFDKDGLIGKTYQAGFTNIYRKVNINAENAGV